MRCNLRKCITRVIAKLDEVINICISNTEKPIISLSTTDSSNDGTVNITPKRSIETIFNDVICWSDAKMKSKEMKKKRNYIPSPKRRKNKTKL